MRVISGTARGLKLDSLDGMDTRPTLDRVKEAVFSMLFDKIVDSQVLDLFAGSGALGIECLSRGANRCVFVDLNKKATEIVNNNLKKARLDTKAEVITKDFKSYLTGCKESFDLIFLDPPYKMGAIGDILKIIKENNILNKGGIIIVESDANIPPEITCFNIVKNKNYGRVSVFILEE